MSKPARMVYQTEATRSLILECAEAVFVERGFFDAQMSEIATASGMSRHTLYRYFQDKTDLGLAIIGKFFEQRGQELCDRLNKILQETHRPALERFERFLREDASRLLSSSEGKFLAEFDAYFSNQRAPSGFRDKMVSIASQEPFRLAEQLLEQGQSEGGIRTDIPVSILVRTTLSAIRSLHYEAILRGEVMAEYQEGEAVRSAHYLIDLFVAGLAPPPSSRHPDRKTDTQTRPSRESS